MGAAASPGDRIAPWTAEMMDDHDHQQRYDETEQDTVRELHDKIIDLVLDHVAADEYWVGMSALTQAIVTMAGALDCDSCRRRTAQQLKKASWLHLFNKKKEKHYWNNRPPSRPRPCTR
jgi:hypothetical protein